MDLPDLDRRPAPTLVDERRAERVNPARPQTADPRSSGTSRRWRLAPVALAAELRTCGLLLVALLVTVAGLHVVLSGAGWWFMLAALITVLLGATLLVRRFSRRPLAPTIVAFIVLAVALIVYFVPQNAILGIVPTAGTVVDIQSLISAANLSIAQQSIPALATPPIAFLLCAGIGVIAITADFFANTLRAPALAGIPLLVLLAVPTAISIDITDPIVFVLAALSYLALLRSTSGRRQTRLALILSVTVVVGALVVPPLLPAVTPAEDTSGSGFSSGVNPVLSLGQNLRQDIEHPVLSYSTTSGNPQYLRLVSIDNFAGASWSPDSFKIQPRNTPQAIGAAPGLDAGVKTTRDTTYVSVAGLTSPWLPLPYPTASVSGLAGDWFWDSDGLAVKSPNRTAQDETYRAAALAIAPTPVQLESAGTTVPAGFDRFLALPSSLPPIISQTANDVAGKASSNYQKAILLQDFFRYGDFQYSETTPADDGYDGTGMKVIASFLRAKSGYCIHFASAMAVMARTLGIPSRIAVGFLPGTKLNAKVDGRTAYGVTSHNLHAWPELYFEGIGWTRFEPTVSRGEVPAYADVTAPDVPIPVNSGSTTTTPLVTAKPTPTPSAAPRQSIADNTGAATAASSSEQWVWLLLAIAIIALLLLIPAIVRVRQRSLRLRAMSRGSAPPSTGWREVLQTAVDLGRPIADNRTPREAAAMLGGAVNVSTMVPEAAGSAGASMTTIASTTAIDRLRLAVERESYAPPDDAGYRQAADDTAQVIAQLRAEAGRRTRILSALAPGSLWERILRPNHVRE